MGSIKLPLYDSDKKYIRSAHLILATFLACTDRGVVLALINLLFNVSKTKILSALGKHAKQIFGKSWDFGPRRGGGGLTQSQLFLSKLTKT